jgi:pilus assembly protein Flp/PilA
MRNAFVKLVSRFRRDDEGVTLVEYGIAVALAITVGTVALLALGANITQAMNAAGAAMLP